MGKRFLAIIQAKEFILVLYALIAIGVAIQEFLLSRNPNPYTHYNNYIIFRQAFFHLIHRQDLYILYPAEHWDYYKYSPTFAAFMGLLAYLPDLMGLAFWNMLNALVLCAGIFSLPATDHKIKFAISYFVVIEMITSLQNSQSNALIAGLLILAFSFLERRSIALGTLMIALTVFIKLFGLVAFSLFFLYPDKKRFALYSIMWMIALMFLPVIFVSPGQLIFQYENWWRLLNLDYESSMGFSVMGWLQTWFTIYPPKNVVTLVGAGLFLLPLLFYRRFNENIFRWLFLSNILIWVIIFNHKAESATFIIAVCGIAIWYFSQERNYFNLILLVLAFIFTCLSPTDLFPRSIRTNLVVPYTLKAVPCILIWGKIIYELVSASYKPLRVGSRE